MHQLTTTPFGQRQVSACLLRTVNIARQTPALASADKWALFRQLCSARKAFAVTDRDLAVLNALLSFHPCAELRADTRLVVFPSNNSLCERTHGMAESTLRRHLAALVAAGLILRHDSPNGKRYARRGPGDGIRHAFGFDLRPLLARATDIEAAAATAAQEADDLRDLRERITLLRRDAVKLLDYVSETFPDRDTTAQRTTLDHLRTLLRRKLPLIDLQRCIAILTDINAALSVQIGTETPEMTASDSQNGRHLQRTKKEYIFLPDPIRTWTDLVDAAERIARMMGITPTTWIRAIESMGRHNAATKVACMLEKGAAIRNPGAYLNALGKSARDGRFSPVTMVTSLLRSPVPTS